MTSALIFCNRKRDVGILHRSLTRHGFASVELHGDLPQPVRLATLEKFKKGEVQLLVCSDVAARGLDIPAVSHVFNFDVPSHSEDYIHRIGRTGRAGRSGKAFMLATPAESRALSAIQKMLGRKIPLAGAADSPKTAPEPAAEPAAEPAPVKEIAEQPCLDTPCATEIDQPKKSARGKPAKTPKSKAKQRKAKVVPIEESVAFGEHTPAFLLRPVRLAASA